MFTKASKNRTRKRPETGTLNMGKQVFPKVKNKNRGWFMAFVVLIVMPSSDPVWPWDLIVIAWQEE